MRNVAYLENGVPVDVTPAMPLPTSVTEFEVSVEIVRSSTTNAYSANQIINVNAAAVLPTLNFPAAMDLKAAQLANRRIQINSATILSSNGAGTAMAGKLHLFDINNPQAVTDYSGFNPTYAVMKANRKATIEDISQIIHQAPGCYIVTQTDLIRNAVLNANGVLFALLIPTAAYTPASGETITIGVKGYLLN